MVEVERGPYSKDHYAPFSSGLVKDLEETWNRLVRKENTIRYWQAPKLVWQQLKRVTTEDKIVVRTSEYMDFEPIDYTDPWLLRQNH